MNYFKKWNLIIGWSAFAISAIVYLLTIEPTASFWDCSEFIATSYKLEVGHPPGAPLFMMIGRFFSMFASSPENVGMMVNAMSAICGAFTVLFLCWSITHMGRRIYERDGKKMSKSQTLAVLGAGFIGSLAYCFTDTQWFSAVEAEVYSMSTMFTALIFWCILQWENVADKPHSSRWLILIAYLMGLSIGIHILNLLAIPAIVFVYYFKKYSKVTTWGVIKATLIAGAILVAINYIIIPYTISIGAGFDRFFVNTMGLPVNSGITFFALLVFALCALGIYLTHKKGKVVANIIILCTTFIFLGFSSYASMIIRAQADPPMNSNDPSNPYSLLSVLNRDQYGERPLLYGPYYSSQAESAKTRKTTYLGEDGKYHSIEQTYALAYPDEMKYLFPRMWDDRKAEGYKSWGNVEGRPAMYQGQRLAENVPTFGENMRFFFNYQLNFMYWRYFLWNFVGRQNDLQGNGDLLQGNWLSGISFIDEMYLGPQDNIPSEMADNKGRNKYYFLPFILGLIGLIYQLGRDKKNFTVVMWLFIMMGIALVVYFNTTPSEPRERDYVYAGSFYAFSMWIGLGVMALYDWLTKLTKKDSILIAGGVIVICSSVPVILAVQNWDDHDRSGRYVARDYGFNYLESTLPNSIIINFGDNDTFPLWYNQEVENVRPDVRIMNTSYLSAEWYIDQMTHKYNDSEPLPFSLPKSKYTNTNGHLEVVEMVKEAASLKEIIDFVRSENRDTKARVSDGTYRDYIPTKYSYIPVNKENAIASGIVKQEDAHLIVDSIPIVFNKRYLEKNEMMLMDMLANFDWKRPIYFTVWHILTDFGLEEYLQFDGFGYRLVPIRTKPVRSMGRIDTEYLYTKLMDTYRYGNMKDPKVYVDYTTNYQYRASETRAAFARLAEGLLMEGDTLRAVAVLDRAVEELPFTQLRHDERQTAQLIEGYYKAGEFEKGNAILDDYANILEEYVMYFIRFDGKKGNMMLTHLETKLRPLQLLYRLALVYKQEEQVKHIAYIFDLFEFE